MSKNRSKEEKQPKKQRADGTFKLNRGNNGIIYKWFKLGQQGKNRHSGGKY